MIVKFFFLSKYYGFFKIIVVINIYWIVFDFRVNNSKFKKLFFVDIFL